MTSSIDLKLSNIENLLHKIESKMDNFMGFETQSKKEEIEFEKIKEEFKQGKANSYEEVFN